MFPLKDNIKAVTFPFINYFLIIVNFLFFFFDFSLGSNGLNIYITKNAFNPYFFTIGLKQGLTFADLLKPVFLSMFLHGGWLHILGNMWFLYIFGDNVEDKMGHLPYLVFYFLSGLAAATIQYISNPFMNIPMIGASGAIAGVLGAYLIFYPRAKVLTLLIIIIFIDIVYLPAALYIILWFLMQVFLGSFSYIYPHSGGIAWWAHIGGFIWGVVFAIIITPFSRKIDKYYHEINPW